MLQAGRGARLAEEARARRLVGREVAGHHLDRHFAIEHRIAAAVEHAHAASAHPFDDFVAPYRPRGFHYRSLTHAPSGVSSNTRLIPPDRDRHARPQFHPVDAPRFHPGAVLAVQVQQHPPTRFLPHFGVEPGDRAIRILEHEIVLQARARSSAPREPSSSARWTTPSRNTTAAGAHRDVWRRRRRHDRGPRPRGGHPAPARAPSFARSARRRSSPTNSDASSGAASIRSSSPLPIGPAIEVSQCSIGMVTIRNTIPASSTPWPSTRQPQRGRHQVLHAQPRPGRTRTRRAVPAARATRTVPSIAEMATSPGVTQHAAAIQSIGSDARDDIADSFGAGSTRVRSSSKPSRTCTPSTGAGLTGGSGDAGRFRRAVVEEAHRQVRDLHQVARAQRGFAHRAAVDAHAVAALEIAHDQAVGGGQKLGVAARQPRVAVADVAAGIAAHRHPLAHHQLALAAPVVENQPTAHVVAPNCFICAISALSATRRASRSALISASAARRNGTTPSASPPRSSSTG